MSFPGSWMKSFHWQPDVGMSASMIHNGMRPIHPGEVLREEFLVPLKMSAHALAMRLRVPAPRINDVVRDAA